MFPVLIITTIRSIFSSDKVSTVSHIFPTYEEYQNAVDAVVLRDDIEIVKLF